MTGTTQVMTALRSVVDTRRFPLVWIPAQSGPLDDGEADRFIADLTQLLIAGERYVLLADNGPPPLSEAGSDAFTRWFRSERVRLQRVCAGMVMVIPAGPMHDAAAMQVQAMTKTDRWPYPMVVKASHAEAEAWARIRLDSED